MRFCWPRPFSGRGRGQDIHRHLGDPVAEATKREVAAASMAFDDEDGSEVRALPVARLALESRPMKRSHVQSLRLDEITCGESPVGDLQELMASISEVGLLQPVVVTPHSTGCRLVAGRRRLEAVRNLGWAKIPATVVTLDEIRTEIAAIDENLVRRELSVLERAEQLRRRKDLYEALYPDARGGRAGGLASGASRRGEARTDLTMGFVRQVTEKLGRSRSAIHREIRIATAIPEDVRNLLRVHPVADDLTDLGRLANLPVQDQRAVAAKIQKGQARGVVHALRLITSSRSRRRRQAVPTDGPYGVLVIDPPWRYEHERTPYETMSLEEIQSLPVGDLADQDAVLFLWATNAMLRHAYTCLDSWGFVERSVLTWDKMRRSGTGHYLIGVTEHAILATRGKPEICLTTQTTLLRAPSGRHSAKPDEFFTLVESLCPSQRRVELFARRRRDGWVSWGDIARDSKRAG